MDEEWYAALITRSWLHRLHAAMWHSGQAPLALARVLPSRTASYLVRSYVVNRWQAAGPLPESTIDLVATYATGVLVMPAASERCLPLMLRAFAASRTPIGPIVETLPVPVTFLYGRAVQLQVDPGFSQLTPRLLSSVETKL